MDNAEASARDCTDPSRGELLLDYALNSLDHEHGTDFEAHMLECDACFENFRAVVLTSAYLGDVVDRHPGSLPPAFQFLRRRSRSRWMTRALVALVLLGLGFLAGFLISRTHQSDAPSNVGISPTGRAQHLV